jgi:hypothetical protein
MSHSLIDRENFILDHKTNPCFPVSSALELSTHEAAEFESDQFSVWLNPEVHAAKRT